MDPVRMKYHNGWVLDSDDLYQLWEPEEDKGWRAARTGIDPFGSSTTTFHEASLPYLAMTGAEFPASVRLSFERVWLLSG